MPTATLMVCKEAPRMSVVFFWHQDPYPVISFRSGSHVFLPDHREKQRAGRVHDSNIREKPVTVVGLQRVDHTQEERVLRNRPHGVVRDASGRSATNPGMVRKEWI